ncbi:SCO family protein [Campylobacter sp. VicNov18]|uniref:SCO family protein n=1 Tax=Campylobacter bilis TaxID=2691918 RepID=UPI00130D9B4F|nr:SCO family protein [Campylobacter bilis]MPV63507.1 redoxin domain-containing protein [Campylobacter hepaticus]MBM0637007.1 redoxin domain-containing protein [Campylobacter bilis]MCC8277838.1 SCO family protein [Campylobacter bilis]MCC8299448.1 SCO family protein [Campylobacter bilis]MCC8300748.1 SCO family protein [Campylobacter bilis]
MKKFIPIIITLSSLVFFINFKQNPYDFNLKSEFKTQTTLKDFKGKKLIIYFGYTSCPDVCPTTLALIAKILKQINNPKAYILFISLDPIADNNLKNTNQWLKYFYPKSYALIPKDESTLKHLAKNYQVLYQKIPLKNSQMPYTIAHSNELFLIDEKGHFYKSINDLNPQELTKELQNFLN